MTTPADLTFRLRFGCGPMLTYSSTLRFGPRQSLAQTPNLAGGRVAEVPRITPQGSTTTLLLHRERVTAPARGGFVRITELEALEHQGFLVIEQRTGQINQALFVDVELH